MTLISPIRVRFSLAALLISLLFTRVPVYPSDPLPSETGDVFTLPVFCGDFTVYLPSNMEYKKVDDSLVFSNRDGNLQTRIFFAFSKKTFLNLYRDDAGRAAFFDRIIQSVLSDERVISCYDVQVDECVAKVIRMNLSDDSYQPVDIVVLLNRHEMLGFIVATKGSDENALSDLTSGILAHIVAPEIPLDP